jgi:hypothetical protein
LIKTWFVSNWSSKKKHDIKKQWGKLTYHLNLEEKEKELISVEKNDFDESFFDRLDLSKSYKKLGGRDFQIIIERIYSISFHEQRILKHSQILIYHIFLLEVRFKKMWFCCDSILDSRIQANTIIFIELIDQLYEI